MNQTLHLAGCIIVDPAGNVLLLHRNTPKRTQWETPGGKIEPGESAAEAAVREAKEELTVDIRIIKPLGTHDFTEDGRTMHYTWFLAEVISGTPRVGEPATFDDLRAFSQTQLQARQAQLSGNTRNFLAAWTAAEFTLTSD